MKTGVRPSRRSKNPLAGVLASDALSKLATQFVLWPGAALHFQALKRATGLPNRSLQNELARLERLGLLCREPDGRLVRYRAQIGHPGWQAVRALVAAFADPADVVHAAIAAVPGVDAAFIYGSYARSTNIHPASDVDVIVIGERVDDPETRSSLAGSALEAAGLVGREVNLVRYTPGRLRDRYARGGRFLRGVLEGPKRWLVGDDHWLTGHLRGVTRTHHVGNPPEFHTTKGNPT
jgi:predicted nucleotidyltransferase